MPSGSKIIQSALLTLNYSFHFVLDKVENYMEWSLHVDTVNHPEQRHISSSHLGRSSIHRHNNAVGRRLVVGFCGQSASSTQLFDPATLLRPAAPIVDTAEPLPNRPGPCRANLHKWGLAASELGDCGQWQTMDHIVNSCPLTRLTVGMTRLYKADDDAVYWLKTKAATAPPNDQMQVKWRSLPTIFSHEAKESYFFANRRNFPELIQVKADPQPTRL